MQIDTSYLRATLYRGLKNMEDKQWIEAFDQYNANNPVALAMNCGACYAKVLAFIQDQKIADK